MGEEGRLRESGELGGRARERGRPRRDAGWGKGGRLRERGGGRGRVREKGEAGGGGQCRGRGGWVREMGVEGGGYGEGFDGTGGYRYFLLFFGFFS